MQRTQFNRPTGYINRTERIALAATHGRRGDFCMGMQRAAHRWPARCLPWKSVLIRQHCQQWILFSSAPLNGIYNVISTFVSLARELYGMSFTTIFHSCFMYRKVNLSLKMVLCLTFYSHITAIYVSLKECMGILHTGTTRWGSATLYCNSQPWETTNLLT